MKMRIKCLGSREGTISDELRTGETITRMSEVIAAQTSPVCLVVTGDDLSKKSLFIFLYFIKIINIRCYSSI